MLATNDYIACPEQVDDFRERIHPKKDFAQTDTDYIVRSYYQVFDMKLGFLPNLSIVDLLFNMGNEAVLWLEQE